MVDVTLRDGLQDQPQFVATADKVRIAQLLIEAGYRELEVTSMMRPDSIPQTADGEDVLAQMQVRPGIRRHVLVGNRRGLDRALNTDAEVITFVISASTLHNQRNLLHDPRKYRTHQILDSRCQGTRPLGTGL